MKEDCESCNGTLEEKDVGLYSPGSSGLKRGYGEVVAGLGRWPANFIHDGSDEVVALFPDTASGKPAGQKNIGNGYHGNFGSIEVTGFGDSGSAARFFYCAKASKRDRNEGLDGFEAIETQGGGGRPLENYGEDDESQRLKKAASA